MMTTTAVSVAVVGLVITGVVNNVVTSIVTIVVVVVVVAVVVSVIPRVVVVIAVKAFPHRVESPSYLFGSVVLRHLLVSSLGMTSAILCRGTI